ncbi:MAG: glycosyltransferase family 4 protein [Candidatus Jorgensenbacteria bacterium]|nr:glycosyltransferase family 4 protein [Candidatus Jorgensenbacteria bacterium]
MKKKILIITDSYPPELRSASELMGDLAISLHDRGHEITVLTSYPKYNLANSGHEVGAIPLDIVENNIRVIRVRTLPHHKVNFIIRGISQLFLPYIFWFSLKKRVKEKFDVVIVHSPPLPLTITTAKVQKYYGAKYLLNLHDFFPQNAVDLGVLTIKPIIKFFEKMEFGAYKKSDLIVVPSNEHKKFLEKNRGIAKEKISVIPHWINMSPFISAKRTGTFRKKFGLEDKFVFVFGGVLGPSQGLDLILRLAAKLNNYPDIAFLFVGDGGEKENLVKTKEEQKLNNVVFGDWISKEDYPSLLKDMDVGFFSLTSKNTTPAVPAKLMGYLAAGLPTVAFLHNESEGHAIIKEANCGYSALYEDEADALKIIIKIYEERNRIKEYGENGFRYAEANFTKEVCAEKWEALF